MDDIIKRIATEQSDGGPDDGEIDRALDRIAETTDDIARRRGELCLLESRVSRLQRQNAELESRWLEFAERPAPSSVGDGSAPGETRAPIGARQTIDIPDPPAANPRTAPERERSADDRADQPPRRGIRAVFARARLAEPVAQDPPPSRTNS